VFDAWTNPEVLRRWFAAGPDAECAEAVVDLRPGGAYRLAMKVPTGDVYVCIGEYVEIDRPKRLVFTWRWEGITAEGDGVGGSTVALDFAPDGAGTLVSLNHHGFLSEQSRDQHAEGWAACLGELERRVFP